MQVKGRAQDFIYLPARITSLSEVVITFRTGRDSPRIRGVDNPGTTTYNVSKLLMTIE